MDFPDKHLSVSPVAHRYLCNKRSSSIPSADYYQKSLFILRWRFSMQLIHVLYKTGMHQYNANA
jgi:hypothetical protein